jgi:pimeloyl-ACP methyl ester carboxylesterase
MKFNEETFTLLNNKQESLYGIIHGAEAGNGGLAIFFNIGLHYRVSHSRLFVRHARYLQENGFTVARVDTSGVGYSHGEIPSGRAIDTFDSIQTGRFKDDAITVIKYLKDKLKPRKIYLIGLCGGALTATIAASQIREVDGVVFMAGPITVTAADFELSTMHLVVADVLLKGYLNRIFSPKAWLNLLTGKSSYSDLYKMAKVKLSDKFRFRKRKIQAYSQNMPAAAEEKGSIFNTVFLKAFESLLKSDRKVLFVLPELDRATYDFDRIFVENYLGEYDGYKSCYKIVRIPGSDHTFSRPESSARLFQVTNEWLISRMGD